MAAASSHGDDVCRMGYDVDLFVDQTAVGRLNLICPICLQVVRKAVCNPAPQCGHTFCEGCFQEYRAKGGSDCPVCKTRIERPGQVYSVATDRLVDQQVVRCPHPRPPTSTKKRRKNEGTHACTWQGYLSDQARHAETCDWAPVECQTCGQDQPRCQIESHRPQCASQHVACPECKGHVRRDNLNNHNCPEELVDCPFGVFGMWRHQVKRKDLNEQKNHVHEHLDVLRDTLELYVRRHRALSKNVQPLHTYRCFRLPWDSQQVTFSRSLTTVDGSQWRVRCTPQTEHEASVALELVYAEGSVHVRYLMAAKEERSTELGGRAEVVVIESAPHVLPQALSLVPSPGETSFPVSLHLKIETPAFAEQMGMFGVYF